MSTEPSPDTGGNPKDTAKEQSEQRLPFEPRTKRKKTAKAPPEPEKSPSQMVAKKDLPKKQSVTEQSESMTVPEVVSKRMVRRMALLCGVPSVLGIATFFCQLFFSYSSWDKVAQRRSGFSKYGIFRFRGVGVKLRRPLRLLG